MRRIYDPSLKATVTLDDERQIRGINYLDGFPDIKQLRGRVAAKAYFRAIAEKFAILPEQLRNIDQSVSYVEPLEKDVEYHFSEEKTFFNATTYAYYQTYLNTPVWAAGITATIKRDPARVLAATNTSESGIDAKLPSTEDIRRYRELFAIGEKGDGGPSGLDVKQSRASDARASRLLSDILGEAAPEAKKEAPETTSPKLVRGRFFVYRYNSEKRISGRPAPKYEEGGKDTPDTNGGSLPTLPVPPVPESIQEGSWYLVAELIVRLPLQGHPINWRMLVDVETNGILYLRALVSGINGLVFTYDPIRSTDDDNNNRTRSNAVLNPLRDEVVLKGLDPPVAGVQSLSGQFVTIVEVEDPEQEAPTRPEGSDFDVYDVRTWDFAAVNAYYHNDRFFRLVESLGFPLDTYFDGTSFPITVDHRGITETDENTGVVTEENNAHCDGDGSGITHLCYGLSHPPDDGSTDLSTDVVGNACDWSVVLHELGGHGILWDHVGDANFGFSHSAGDSFSVILNDYISEWHNGGAIDRFVRSPFRPLTIRRSDRAVADGWGWGGPHDIDPYHQEQILSTTMFRVYRSIGGDSDRFTRREFAARYMAWLMLRAVGMLTSVSNPSSPAKFLDALLAAEMDDWTSEGIFGGAYGKVLTWSFERQDLNGGDPPLIDVYIDDSRAGEYEYLDVYWETAAIWNRRLADGVDAHQEPSVGTNYAYVKIRNRGTSVADNVVVRGFHCKPLAGLVWPDDLQPMTTPELAAGTIQPNDTEELTIGPFEWTPGPNAEGHDSMLMVVSAPGDPSNTDNFTADREIEDWRLVPNDNNIGLRNVKLEPRLVTVIADSGNFGNVCVGSFKDMGLVLSNSGFGMLSVSNIISFSADFLLPSVMSYPIVIGSGDSIEVPIRFQPNSFGPKAATITVFSSDPESPKVLDVSGAAMPPRLVSIIADNGNFGDTCLGSFVDKMLILSNSGQCRLTISDIESASSDFLVANVLSYPIVIGAGDSLQVPIRFEPASFGAKAGTITITSDDPDGEKTIRVSGTVPSGKLVVTGSTCIGGVKACCAGERTISICNVGDCAVHVTSVGFSRKSKHWRLVNNPFPARLHPGSCLSVLIRYKATEKCPRCLELVIKSDDPDTPVKTLDLMAYTVWTHSGHRKDCEDCCKGCCEAHCDECCTPQSLDACCFDEECDHEDDES